jgi:hypothetical protein
MELYGLTMSVGNPIAMYISNSFLRIAMSEYEGKYSIKTPPFTDL